MNDLNIQTELEKHFGWTEFKPGQAEVVSRLLDGKSTLAVFPTGGGKSLCYQLPALMLEGLTVVVSPLIALMKDQIDQLLARNVVAVRLDSSLSFDEYRDAVSKIRQGLAKLLYVAPERFFNERFRSELDGVKISLFAIDEAHCISQWGHNFRPDYLKLAGIASRLNVERVLCLTATATPRVQQDVCDTFQIADEDVVSTRFFRANLHIRSQVVAAGDRDSILIGKLKNSLPGATIVYVTLQKTAEEVANLCQNANLEARAYHAGMDAETRSEIQDWFMSSQRRIIVATIAFGMGIDKSDIRYIYHYNPPKSIESYAQEIGRAGRDGEVSQCEMLLVAEDKIVLENFVYGDTPSQPSLVTFLKEVDNQPDEFFVSPIKLGNLSDIRSIVTKTLLTYLELDGYLESTAPRYENYQFIPNITGAELLDHFQGERQNFVRGLLSCARKKKIWFTIELETAMQKLDCERVRIVKALDYFAENGWIELKASRLVHGYRRLNPIESVEQLASEYFNRVVDRESGEIQRTRQVLQLACARECQAAAISAHFGQPMETTCGQCSFCLEQGPFEVPEPDHERLATETIATLQRLVSDHPAALNSSRAIARFVCGITSPALTRAKLSRHAMFGYEQSIPFDQVMQQVESEIAINTEPPF